MWFRSWFKEILSENKLLELTWNTISSVRALLESFGRIPDQAYAIDGEEALGSTRSIGAPALISQDRPVVAIGIPGPMSILEQQIASLSRGAFMKATRKISGEPLFRIACPFKHSEWGSSTQIPYSEPEFKSRFAN